MSDYISVRPHPALELAYLAVEAMKAEGIDFAYEGTALIAVAQTLMRAERQGSVSFGHEYGENLSEYRDALKELVASIGDSEDVANAIYDGPTASRPAPVNRVRRAMSAAERTLGY